MQEVLINKYVRVTFEPEKSLLRTEYLPTTQEMDGAEFRNILEVILSWVENNSPTYYLVNVNQLQYAIEPIFQQWMAKVYTPRLVQAQVKKYALISPEEFVTSLSVEQVTEEVYTYNQKHFFRIFATEETAHKWFFEKK
jgi:hypothetical protein